MLIVAAMFAGAGVAASAQAATLSGSIQQSEAFLSTRCFLSLGGLDSGTSIAFVGGTFSGCSSGTMALGFSPSWTLTFPTATTFQLADVQETFTPPASIPITDCIYRGGLSGTYSGSSSGGTLMITANSLVKQTGSHALCGTTLTFTGTLTLTRP
ncbi:MAG TPA: hypothetical protein VI072_35830 [Polyangiaceae bacterium]